MTVDDKIEKMWDKEFDRIENAIRNAKTVERANFLTGYMTGFCWALAILHREEKLRKKI